MEKMLGVMIDCSRNAVMTVDGVKKYADIISKMGYNTIMLYTEDTYEIDNNPCFGHFRGRYTKEELKEMDRYITGLGMELIPCIQTLAHLENMFKWTTEYGSVRDCDNVLLIGEEKTYELIGEMFKACRECFSANKIHIGMDEAHRVGTGEYQKRNGIRDRFDIINSHLHKVCDMAKEYNFEPMIWSDMFCKLAMNIGDQYDVEENSSKILEKANLPENVSLVYWDYYSTDYSRYANNIKANKLFKRPVYFAGGAWTWNSPAPRNGYSMETTKVAFDACNTEGVDGMFLTMWGDDGGECSPFMLLPALMYSAEISRGNYDMDDIKKKFYDITGCNFDSIMLLDKFDKLIEEPVRNQCKAFLYNDVFMGMRDYLVPDGSDKYFSELSKEISAEKNVGEFEIFFNHYKNLADVLEIKTSLGLRTWKAYCDKDVNELRNIISDYDEVIKRLEIFHKGFKAAWFKYNKPHGFDVQDIRIGGLIMRIKSSKERLEDFCNGKISSIPELEEPRIDKHIDSLNRWANCVTVNAI